MRAQEFLNKRPDLQLLIGAHPAVTDSWVVKAVRVEPSCFRHFIFVASAEAEVIDEAIEKVEAILASASTS
jgi:hypothetical protein